MSTKTISNTASTPEITYHWEGDYLIPDIGIPEDEANLPPLTRWGRARMDYLKNHRPIIYTNMKLSGKLFLHCHETEKQAESRIEFMMAQMVQKYPVSEDLKNINPLEWVGHMNMLKSQVEEVIRTELIYE